MSGKNWLRPFVLASLAAGIATAADIDSAALLNRVKSRVRENAQTIPRFVCRQQLEREDYSPVSPAKSCRTLGEREFTNPKLTLRLSDRANLDVMVTEARELFAWPGGESFDADTPNVLLGDGFSGSGDFAGFVLSVFSVPAASIEYRGPCETAACVRYSYDMPSFASKYTLRTVLNEVTVGYHGTFDVNPQTADLISLTVIPTDVQKAVSEACDLRTRMTYTKASVAAGVFTIPESTEKLYLTAEGTLFRNRISYRGCRQYTSESAISFGDEDPPQPAVARPGPDRNLPVAGTPLQLRLTSKIDSERNSAGDPIEAKLVGAVRDKQGHAIPAGTVFRGHIGKMEHIYASRPSVIVAIRFDTIVLNGKPVGVPLMGTGITDQRGRKVFRFAGRKVILNSQFVTRWLLGSTGS